MTLFFFAAGVPMTAGNKSAIPFRGKDRKLHVRVVDGADMPLKDGTRNRGKDWRKIIQAAAKQAMGDQPMSVGPILLRLTFSLPRPKSHLCNAWDVRSNAPHYHVSKPDLSKLVRAVEDALTGICWRDDSQIVRHETSKFYNHVSIGVAVEIEELT